MKIFKQTSPNFINQRVDPRIAILLSIGWAIFICSLDSISILSCALGMVILLAIFLQAERAELFLKVSRLNLFLCLLLILMPLSYTGGEGIEMFGLFFSKYGFIKGLAIILRANNVLILFVLLVSCFEPIILAKAMKSFRISDKLIFLMLFTIRYIDTIHQEYHRLRDAMKIRSFVPNLSMHTINTFGLLVGQLLIRSFDRSTAVLEAMKCRGFEGRFYLPVNLKFSIIDFYAVGLFVLSCGGLLCLN